MEVLQATLGAVEAANRPDASQDDLNALGKLFDQVRVAFPACTVQGIQILLRISAFFKFDFFRHLFEPRSMSILPCYAFSDNSHNTQSLQLKREEPHAVATLGSQLAGQGMPVEAQHFGLKLLQHMVNLFSIPLSMFHLFTRFVELNKT